MCLTVADRWDRELPSAWGRQRCLAVGVNDGIVEPCLKHTYDDARAVSGALEGAGYDCMEPLLEKTSRQILAALEVLCKDAEDDHLVFFFSGHGIRQRQGGQQLRPLFLKCGGNTMLPLEDVGRMLARAKTSVIILDCCHAGRQDLTKGPDGHSADEQDLSTLTPTELEEAIMDCLPEQTQSADLDAEQNRPADLPGQAVEGQQVMCACIGTQRASEADGHGLYTRFLLEALEEPHDRGFVTVTELATSVRRRMADNHAGVDPVSYTHLRAHETVLDLVCRLLLEKKKK
eukprot:TRINITY_DN9214_c0_g3_i2.p1 TRINITY_DN9214_c0_g3~~TRINITY_DN9214_c0_g3_i2.p1  ORF type:complete len:289 (-),score=47.69 TRINITY_DN9214_c0_g3_i2:21-887(-)